MATKKIAVKKRVPVRRTVKPIVIEEPITHANESVSLILYRRIAFVFIIVIAVVLLVVMYLSMIDVTIRLTPMVKNFSSDLIMNVLPNPVNPTDIKGTVVAGTMKKTKTFKATGTSEKKADGIAKGMVTIVNKGNTAQPLVATTRLLSTDQVLFRLDKSVVVPANGSVITSVHADKVGKDGDIKPTHFIIPGLNTVKQASIYADSLEGFSGGVRQIAIVTKEDLDQSVSALQEEILNDAKELLKTQSGGTYDGESFIATITDQKTSIKPNTEAESYDVTLTVLTSAVFYDRTVLDQLMMQHVYDGIGQGQTISDTDAEKIAVTVERSDAKLKTASLHAHLGGRLITTRTNKALDVSRFVGMTTEEVKNLLMKEGIASTVDVQYFPFWIKSIPRLKDRINIELK